MPHHRSSGIDCLGIGWVVHVIRTRSFPSCSCLIYTDGSVQLLDFALSSKLIRRHMPDEVLVHQLKVLPRASFSLHLAVYTLPLAMRLPLPAPLGTFTR